MLGDGLAVEALDWRDPSPELRLVLRGAHAAYRQSLSGFSVSSVIKWPR